MLQRPGEAHAIWVFWHGPEREFAGWYVNLQEPFRRTARGYDTQDLELDIWVPVAGDWEWKDADVLDERIREGRYTPEQVEATWAEGRRVVAELEAGRRWWDPWWALWEPDPTWLDQTRPEGAPPVSDTRTKA
jgi:predicted RNA-binding protein associated with RNAse of E/G family